MVLAVGLLTGAWRCYSVASHFTANIQVALMVIDPSRSLPSFNLISYTQILYNGSLTDKMQLRMKHSNVNLWDSA